MDSDRKNEKEVKMASPIDQVPQRLDHERIGDEGRVESENEQTSDSDVEKSKDEAHKESSDISMESSIICEGLSDIDNSIEETPNSINSSSQGK
jgi:hypothetical protein